MGGRRLDVMVLQMGAVALKIGAWAPTLVDTLGCIWIQNKNVAFSRLGIQRPILSLLLAPNTSTRAAVEYCYKGGFRNEKTTAIA